MKTLHITALRENIYNIAENTIAHNDPVRIATKRGMAGLLSEADYASIMETLYILSTPGIREALLESKNEPLSEGVPLEAAAWLTE